MQEIGTIISVTGKNAIVKIKRHAACESCGACQVGKEKMTMKTKAENLVQASPGDNVVVEMHVFNVLKATSIAYGIPLLFFLIGLFSGWTLAGIFHIDQTLCAFSIAILFTVVAYLVILFLEKKHFFNNSYQPKITKIIN